jgi:protein-disulfide isomerase
MTPTIPLAREAAIQTSILRAVAAATRPLIPVAGEAVAVAIRRLIPPAAAEGKNLSATAFLQLASGSPARGSAAAPITIVEFSDFECPFCKAMAATLAQQVLPAEGSNVRLVFKNFPLQFHPWAEQAAEIGECVRRQNEDAFWQLHDFFFDHQRSLTVATLEQQALEFLGSDPSVNLEQVKACMARHEANAVVMRDIAQGQQSDVHGTPTLFINGIRVNGAQNVTLIRKAIAEARAELKPANNAHVGEFTGFWPDVDGSQLNCEVAVGEGVNPCLLF